MAKDQQKDKSLERWIWDATCSFRGAKDAPKYKGYIRSLVFTRRLNDLMTAKTCVNEIASQRN